MEKVEYGKNMSESDENSSPRKQFSEIEESKSARSSSVSDD